MSRPWDRVRGRLRTADELTPAQRVARARWQERWNLPIILAAVVPLFVTQPDYRLAQVVVGVGSWLVFLVDLVVQRRIVPGYLRTWSGRADLAIVVVTFPVYLLPGASSYTAILMLARLARLARVLRAATGLRRLVQRLGTVALVAGVVVVVCSLSAYGAERTVNPEFATVGDALWWGVVTLTTVGYGDIAPVTATGRFAGVAIMFMGIGLLGVLAGSLASLFGLEEAEGDAQRVVPAADAPEATPRDELRTLRAQLGAIERRLGELADGL